MKKERPTKARLWAEYHQRRKRFEDNPLDMSNLSALKSLLTTLNTLEILVPDAKDTIHTKVEQ